MRMLCFRFMGSACRQPLFTQRGVSLADLDNSFWKSEIFGEILDTVYLSRLDKFKPNLPISYRENLKKFWRVTGVSPDTINKFRIHWYPAIARYALILFRYSKFTKMRLTPAEPESTKNMTFHGSITFWNRFGKCAWAGLHNFFRYKQEWFSDFYQNPSVHLSPSCTSPRWSEPVKNH
jgi:hypothetical protein